MHNSQYYITDKRIPVRVRSWDRQSVDMTISHEAHSCIVVNGEIFQRYAVALAPILKVPYVVIFNFHYTKSACYHRVKQTHKHTNAYYSLKNDHNYNKLYIQFQNQRLKVPPRPGRQATWNPATPAWAHNFLP